MRAAVLYTPGTHLEVQQVELEAPRRGEVLVRLAAAGVCHSDLHYIRGHIVPPLPMVLGHEGAGVVEAVGPDVSRVKTGDHVLFLWRAYCGQCFYCLGGQPAHCDLNTPLRVTGRMLDGTTRFRHGDQEIHQLAAVGCFAEATVVPEQSLVKIAREIPLDRAALVGCGVATGVGAALFTAKVQPGQSVLVVGAGGVGLNVIQGAHLAGAYPIIATDVVPAKLDWARQFGATHTIDARQNDPIATTRELTHGRGADFAFEVVGRVETMQQTYEAARKGGTVIIVGLAGPRVSLPVSPFTLVRDEKSIKGALYGSTNIPKDIPLLLELYQAGRLKLDELITRRFSLDQVNEAYDSLERGELARGVIVFD